MKTLILVILISVHCFANFMSKSDIDIINNKQDNGQQFTHTKKDKCEKASGQQCFDITDCKPHKGCKIIQVEVDDHTKPIYSAKSNVQECEGQACYELIEPICNPETLECNYYCDEGYNAYVNEDLTEVYCTKLTGYQKKTIDKLVEDAALKAAYEAEKAAKEQAKIAKQNKKISAKAKLKTCKENKVVDNSCLLEVLELLDIE